MAPDSGRKAKRVLHRWSRVLRRSLLAVVVIISLAFWSFPAPIAGQSTPRFTITDLGTLSGGTSYAYGISNNGQFIVGDANVSTGRFHAFIWHNGIMTDINCPTCILSHAQAVNNKGQAAGWMITTALGLRAFIYNNSTGTITDLGDLPGNTSSNFAQAINNNGWVVGYTSVLGNPIPWIYKGGSGLQQIGQSPQVGVANGINDAGQVTGWIAASPASENQGAAFIYANGRLTTLGAFPGDSFSAGLSIDNHGNVVGFSDTHLPSCCDDFTHALLWPKGQPPIDLGTLLGLGHAPLTRAANNYGEILGCYSSSLQCSKPGDHSFLAAVPTSGSPIMVDLIALASGSGWTVDTVTAINDAGAMVGMAHQTNPNVIHAVAVKPVAVSTANVTAVKSKSNSFWCHPVTKSVVKGVAAGGIVTFIIGGLTANAPVAAAGFTVGVVAVPTAFIQQDLCTIINGKDPFDPNFKTVFSVQFQILPQLVNGNCLPTDLAAEANQALNQFGQAVSNFQAMTVTLNREQSAFTFGDDSSVGMQDQALGNYPTAIANDLLSSQAGLQDLASKIAGTACDVTFTQNDVASFLAALRTQGAKALPSQATQILNLFGITPGQAVSLLLSVSPNNVPTSLSGVLSSAASLLGQLAASFQ